MNDNSNRILILALGNDIMGDDAAGLIAARELKKVFGSAVDIFEVSSAGFSLIDILEGYRKVLILDSIPSGNKSEGSIIKEKCVIREGLSEGIKNKIPQFIQKASRIIRNWLGEEYFWEWQDELEAP